MYTDNGKYEYNGKNIIPRKYIIIMIIFIKFYNGQLLS